MNPVVPIALILTVFVIVLIVAIVLYFLKVWPFDSTEVYDPMHDEWLNLEDPDFNKSQLAPGNICEEPYCGGTWRSPQIEDIYQGTTALVIP